MNFLKMCLFLSKLGGVITPNDGHCHLNKDGEYTHSSVLDYPSISQLNLKVKENSINVIFAVTAQQIEVYEKLAKHIQGSSSSKLKEDSSNIVNLITEEYNVYVYFYYCTNLILMNNLLIFV